MPGQAPPQPNPQDEAPPRKELLLAFYRAILEGRIQESDVERMAETGRWADWPNEIRSKLGYSHRPRPRPQTPRPAPGIPNPMAMASAIMLATREGKLTDQDRRTMDAKHPEDWPREIWEKLGFEPPVPKSSPAVPAGPTGGTPVAGQGIAEATENPPDSVAAEQKQAPMGTTRKLTPAGEVALNAFLGIAKLKGLLTDEMMPAEDGEIILSTPFEEWPQRLKDKWSPHGAGPAIR